MASEVAITDEAGTMGADSTPREVPLSKPELPFPTFRRALRANPDATQTIPPATFFRYARGEVPGTLEWLLRYPDLLEALAADARAMQEGDWRVWKRAVRKRGRPAKARRDRLKDDE